MRIFGSLRELVRMVIRTSSGDVVNIEAADQTNATNTVTIPDMAVYNSQEIVLDSQAQTLTNKTIDGDTNTLQDIGLSSLKTVLGDANKVIRRDASGVVQSGNTIPNTDALVTVSALQTLTGKDIDADVNTVYNIKNADIKAGAAIDASKIGAGSVNNTEFAYLDGVTSGIQSQINTANSNLTTHASTSSGVHGVTGSVVGTTDTQTLSNKTLATLALDRTDVSLSAGEIAYSSSFIFHNITSGTGSLDSITGAAEDATILVQNSRGSDLVVTNGSGANAIVTGTGSNITLKDAAVLILRRGASEWNVIGGAGSGGGLTPSIITGATTAVSGTQYFTNHSTSFEIALPSSPNIGDVFEVVDYANNWDTKPVTLNPANASHSINGAAANENFVLDVKGIWVRVVYVATNNWRIIDPIDPALVTSSLSSGSTGSGEINVVASGSNSATDWTTVGSGPSATTTSTAGDLPLSGISSTALKLTSDTSADTEASDYAGYSIVMPEALKNRKLKVEFWMRPGSNFVASEWSVSVYSGSTRMALSTDSGGFTHLPNQTGKFTTYFDADSSAAYTLRFSRRVNAGANVGILNLAGIIVGPGIQPQGAVVSEWQDYIPVVTGQGGVSLTFAQWRRVGSNMQLRFKYTCGTVDGTALTVSLPSGYNASTSSDSVANGNLVTDYNGATQGGIFPLISSSATDKVYWTHNNTRSGLTALAGNAITVNSSVVSGTAEFKVAEWAGSGTLNVAQNDVEFASVGGTWDADSTTTVFGPAGVTMGGALTATRTKTITWQRPRQTGEEVILQIKPTSGGDWVNAEYIFPYGRQGSFQFGCKIDETNSTATETKVIFYQFREPTNTTYANSSGATAWSTAWMWRVIKAQAGAAVGFGLATSTQSGLVSREYTGSFTANFTTGSGTGATNTSYSISYYRIGKVVTLNIPAILVTTGTGAGTAMSCAAATIPSDLRPAIDITYAPAAIVSGAYNNAIGRFTVTSGGAIELRRTPDNATAWPSSTASNGFPSFSVSYITS